MKLTTNMSSTKKTFIIAEIGSNHNQDLQVALESITAAREAGADAVKFQSINIEKIYYRPDSSTKKLHQRIDLPESWHPILFEHANKEGVTFFSSATYLEAIDLLETLGTSLYKLASAQVGTFPQLVERVAALNKPTLLSTGLVNYSQLHQVIQYFAKHENDQYTILHCNSLYPPSPEQVQLDQMDIYRAMFQCPVGFSDHSMDIFVPLAAVAKGASVIEKHFVLDKRLPTPDAEVSITPDRFKSMVEGIRVIEKACTAQPRLEIEEEENIFKKKISTRLILKKDKRAGDVFTTGDFVYLRHHEGINCQQEPFVVSNFMAQQDIPKNIPLQWEHLKGRNN